MLPCPMEQGFLPLDSWPVERYNLDLDADECRFGLKNNTKTLTVWRIPEEARKILTFFQATLKNSVSVMFWGCIGHNGVGWLVQCHGQINAGKYIEILQDNLHQFVTKMYGEEKRPFIFQHDNAPPHRVRRPRYIRNCVVFMCFRGLQTVLTLKLSKMFSCSQKAH